MARIRTIKPEFFTSEDIVSLSPLARLLYIALWCEADKEGRMVWKPLTFKLRYLPGDNVDVQPLCQEIIDRGLVKLYGDGFAVIPAFAWHQHINPRESESQLPDPTQKQAVATRKPRVPDASPRVPDAHVGREGKGRERKGKEGENTSAVAPPDGVVLSVWADFVDLRKSKKAKLTQTAIDGIRREADKAGWTLDAALRECCARGWTGFKADWVAENKQPRASPAETPYQRSMRERMELIAPSIAAKNPNGQRGVDINPNTFFDTLPGPKPLELRHG